MGFRICDLGILSIGAVSADALSVSEEVAAAEIGLAGSAERFQDASEWKPSGRESGACQRIREQSAFERQLK